jgi:hypothetical protein
MVRRARELTAKPIGINLLLHATEDRADKILAHDPEVFSTAFSRRATRVGGTSARSARS